jgi:uncharacterized protein (TIGR02453 family)
MNEKFFTIVQFLKELSENNSKAWMDENRSRYLACKQDWVDMVDDLIHFVYSIDPSIGYLDPKDTLFRINRDIRFSHNKMPYNTHFSALIGRGGRKSHYASYYFQINQEGKIFIAGGIWEPQPDHLINIRNYIENGTNANKLKKILSDPALIKTYGNLSQEHKGKRAPRGFEKAKNPELMLHKSFIISSASELSNTKDLVKEIKKKFEVLKPFLDYLNKGLLYIK